MTKFSLRDGSTVSDARLNRLKQFDVRSKKYGIRETFVPQAKPRSYSWSCPQHLDQGTEGSCVGFSLTHELIARPVAVKGLSSKFAVEQIYWEAQKLDPWEGGSYPGAEPFYEGTSVLAGMKVLKKLGYIKEYRWAFSLEDLILAVGYKGPAVIGVPWYEGMYEPLSCGHLHINGPQIGGHAILVKGVSVKRETFTVHNSWGTSWGNNGDAYISWEEMGRLLDAEGEAVIPTVRSKP